VSFQTLELSGSLALKPPIGTPSGQPSVIAAFSEKIALERQLSANYTLSSDSAATVSISPLTGVNFLMVKASGGELRVRITSSDGTTQAIPVDSLLVLISNTVDITAIDLLREAGIETEVFLVLGQKD